MLTWKLHRDGPRIHYGSRTGEFPRYAIERVRRSGALVWVVRYRDGSLNDVELVASPTTLEDAKRIAVDDLSYRIAVGQVPVK